jgi:hypothetical protein
MCVLSSPPLPHVFCVVDHSAFESLQEGRTHGVGRRPTAAVRITPLTRIQVGCGS